MYGFIYKWTRKSTGEYYIGQHAGAKDDSYIGSGTKFKRKFSGTDKSDWSREILDFCDDQKSLNEMEIKRIGDLYNTDSLCLNSQSGGKSDYTLSDESLQRCIDAITGREVSQSQRDKVSSSLKGRSISETHKNNLKGNSNRSDKTLYNFYHKDHGEVSSTARDLYKEYGLDPQGIGQLKNGKIKQHRGWIVRCL